MTSCRNCSFKALRGSHTSYHQSLLFFTKTAMARSRAGASIVNDSFRWSLDLLLQKDPRSDRSFAAIKANFLSSFLSDQHPHQLALLLLPHLALGLHLLPPMPLPQHLSPLSSPRDSGAPSPQLLLQLLQVRLNILERKSIACLSCESDNSRFVVSSCSTSSSSVLWRWWWNAVWPHGLSGSR